MKNNFLLKLKLFLFIIFILLTCLGGIFDFCAPDIEDVQVVPSDNCPYYDNDCDNISNAVEYNDANSYLNLDPETPNTNPSLARGMPWDGWIDSAFNLVNTGTGYIHYLGTDPIDTDDWGVLKIINVIEGSGRDWFDDGESPPRIQVGDISKGNTQTLEFGGYFWPHTYHQNGIEIDVRYLKKDGTEGGINIKNDSLKYCMFRTCRMLNTFFSHCRVTKLYISPYCNIVFEGFEEGEVVFDTNQGHDDHFHLRIEDPDGTDN